MSSLAASSCRPATRTWWCWPGTFIKGWNPPRGFGGNFRNSRSYWWQAITSFIYRRRALLGRRFSPLGPALILRLVGHAVLGLQRLLIEQEQIVCDRHQLRLRLFGHQARRPRLLLPQFVLDLVEHLFRFPSSPVQLHDHPGRQVHFVGQELVLLAGLRVGVIDKAHQMSCARPNAPVLGHSVVAHVGRVPRYALNPVEDHVLFHPTDEIDGALLAAALPAGKVDALLVIEDDDALALGHPCLSPLGLTRLSALMSCSCRPWAAARC